MIYGEKNFLTKLFDQTRCFSGLGDQKYSGLHKFACVQIALTLQ